MTRTTRTTTPASTTTTTTSGWENYGNGNSNSSDNLFHRESSAPRTENPYSQNYDTSPLVPACWNSSQQQSPAVNDHAPPALPNAPMPQRRKAKAHRKRHVPVGPAGVWFQSQEQQKKVVVPHQRGGGGTTRRHILARGTHNEERALDEEEGVSQASQAMEEEPLSKKSSDAGGNSCSGGGLSLCSPAWMCMQCDLDLVLPSLPPHWSEVERCAAVRQCLPTQYVLIPELLRPSSAEWKLGRHKKLVLMVQTIHSLTDNLWTVQVTDETGATLTAWVQPKLVRDEQQRPQPRYIRPGCVWLLNGPTTILCPDSSSSSSSSVHHPNHHHKLGRMLLISSNTIERVWTPAHAKEISDDQFVQWLERRSVVTAQVVVIMEQQQRAQQQAVAGQSESIIAHRHCGNENQRQDTILSASDDDDDSSEETEIEFEGSTMLPLFTSEGQRHAAHNRLTQSQQKQQQHQQSTTGHPPANILQPQPNVRLNPTSTLLQPAPSTRAPDPSTREGPPTYHHPPHSDRTGTTTTPSHARNQSSPMQASQLSPPAHTLHTATANTIITAAPTYNFSRVLSPLPPVPEMRNAPIPHCSPLSQANLQPLPNPIEHQARSEENATTVKPTNPVQGRRTSSAAQVSAISASADNAPPLIEKPASQTSSRRSQSRKRKGLTNKPRNSTGRKLKAPSALWTASKVGLLELSDEDEDDEHEQPVPSSSRALRPIEDPATSLLPSSPASSASQEKKHRTAGPSLFQMSSYRTLDLGDLFDDDDDDPADGV